MLLLKSLKQTEYSDQDTWHFLVYILLKEIQIIILDYQYKH